MALQGLPKSDFVPTKCSEMNKNAENEFEIINFTSQKAKSPKGITKKSEERNNANEAKSVDMRKLRFEVIKLGTSGMDPTKKEASKIAMAVALGAKPPKNKRQNYKEILKAKSKEKEKVGSNSKKNLVKQLTRQSKRHLYVVGDKVIPAKPKEKTDIKNFLEGYGKPGQPTKGKGLKKKKRS